MGRFLDLEGLNVVCLAPRVGDLRGLRHLTGVDLDHRGAPLVDRPHLVNGIDRAVASQYQRTDQAGQSYGAWWRRPPRRSAGTSLDEMPPMIALT